MNEEWKKYDSMSIIELANELNRVRGELDALKEVKSPLEKLHQFLKETKIPEKMDDEGISTMTIDGLGRLGLTSDLYARIPAESREGAWKWLRDHNHGDIIKETVNAGTLKAVMKSILKDPEQVQPPEELFKLTPVSRASITKIK